MQSGSTIEFKIPDDFISPISKDLMTHPISTPTGRSFQKEELIQWIRQNHTDPFSQKSITEDQLILNFALKFAIDDYSKMNKTRVSLLEIYHHRGSTKIAELKQYLLEINNHIVTEEKGEESKFTVNKQITVWPFPIICSKTGNLLTNPVFDSDGNSFEKPKDSKEFFVPNINLKNTLNLFSIEVDNKLSYQIKKIKRLIKQAKEANSKLTALKLLKSQARLVALEHEKEELIKQLKKIKQQKRRQKILWGSAFILLTVYTCAFGLDYFYGEEDNKSNGGVLTEHGFFRGFTKPLFTSFAILQASFASFIKQLVTLDEKRYYNRVFQNCHANVVLWGKHTNESKAICTKAVNLALKYQDMHRLHILDKNTLGFVIAMRQALEDKNFEDLKMLYQLNPLLLLEFMRRDKQLGQAVVEFLIRYDYPVCPSSENPILFNTNIRHAYSVMKPYGPSPLVIATGNDNLNLTKLIIEHDLPLAKQIMSESPKLMSWITKLSNHNNQAMLIMLIKAGVFPVSGLNDILIDAVVNGYKSIVTEVLKTNLMNYETIKQAAIQAHKKHAGIYNLLRNQMRILSVSVTPPGYVFFPPASSVRNNISKESQRTIRRGR